jgi:MFS transporter, ACDE family, multidrug resistance protein
VTELDPRRRTAAAWTLLLARAVYAYNWYDVGGVLPLIGTHFAIGTVPRGIVLASFLAGAAVFQLPAGIVSMRWGTRSTSIVALGGMGAFALASGFSPDWIVLALLRFGAGAGAAFFFAPALGLVTTYYPTGKRGFMIGAYNAAFAVGSGIGLFVSAYLGPEVGWSPTIALGGLLLLAVALAAIPLVPGAPNEARVEAGAVRRTASPVLRSRRLWALAIGGGGLWGGFYIAAQYYVDFAHTVHPAWSLAVAAAAPTVMIAVEVAGGPIGGWFGERSSDMRRPLVLWGIATGAILAIVPYLGLVPGVLAFVPLGFANGVTFALLYLLPTYFPEIRGNVVAFALALENFVQILVGAALAIVFALVASAVGYSWGWLFAGAATVAFLPVLAFAGRGGAKPLPVA